MVFFNSGSRSSFLMLKTKPGLSAWLTRSHGWCFFEISSSAEPRTYEPVRNGELLRLTVNGGRTAATALPGLAAASAAANARPIDAVQREYEMLCSMVSSFRQ